MIDSFSSSDLGFPFWTRTEVDCEYLETVNNGADDSQKIGFNCLRDAQGDFLETHLFYAFENAVGLPNELPLPPQSYDFILSQSDPYMYSIGGVDVESRRSSRNLERTTIETPQQSDGRTGYIDV